MANPILDEWCSDDGAIRLLLGDAAEILPTLDPSDYGLVVADPPYGIGWDSEDDAILAMSAGVRADGSQRSNKSWSGWKPTGYGRSDWDQDRRPDIVQYLVENFPKCIVWGGNYYSDVLPISGGWLIWSKGVDIPNLSKCELAWTNCLGHTEFLHCLWSGFKKAEKGKRQHITQKPVKLMDWCLSFAGGHVIDPMMGSGTTGIACVRAGRPFTGIERNPAYFATCQDRISAELSRHPLFDSPAVKTEQKKFF